MKFRFRNKWVQLIARAFVLYILIFIIPVTLFLLWAYYSYPETRDAARLEEKAFWAEVDEFTLEDRAALLSYSFENDMLPRVLPWWDYDAAACSTVVTKYINLFTGVKLVHTSAWNLRTYRLPCTRCVSNDRKLTTVWDRTELFDENGRLPEGVKEELVTEVKGLSLDPRKLYVIGLLWEETTYWEQIKVEGPDINSHVALLTHGQVIHFIHLGDDPMIVESIDDLFAGGEQQPVWIAEVHRKTRAYKSDNYKILRKKDLVFPKTERRFAFEQRVMPYWLLRLLTQFPSKPGFEKESWNEYFRQADVLIEKSLLHHVRFGYDMYPQFKEVE
jgi:hypothetical protein